MIVRKTESDREIAQAHAIRIKVFVEEQKCPLEVGLLEWFHLTATLL